ncbi:muscarinic acetylcholine receptor DM1 [Caerostris extrusa]|uniref:Muscarinic acetylcholine receptor DM1 n=1 Tax=Caerostris extrusa TaxID=172846 RepID=A0AAV4TMR4_CAEEX|nr:muscarinic acetylcholine receptor DM1 [Caerostris extrusa]
MTERNGQKRPEPEWKRQTTSLTPKPVPIPVVPTSSVSVPSTSGARPRQPATAPATPQTPAPDSIYTILIRLPQKSASVEGESQPSIKMIMEDDPDAIVALPDGDSSENKTTLEGGAGGSSSLKAADSVEAIRLPLNTKLVHKQVAKHRVPKKKRKHHERKQEMKAAKTLSAILFAFTVTWTPYNVLVLYKTPYQLRWRRLHQPWIMEFCILPLLHKQHRQSVLLRPLQCNF